MLRAMGEVIAADEWLQWTRKSCSHYSAIYEIYSGRH